MPNETSHWTDWWAGAAGVVVGSFIPIGLAWWARRTARLGELDAMIADLIQGERCMKALLKDNVEAPLYRLPLRMFDLALPKLIGEGQLTQNEVGGLLEYVMRAEELNRGLDRAGAAHAAQQTFLVEVEYRRNCAKADEILNVNREHLSGAPLIVVAWDALLRVEEQHWLRMLRIRISKTWKVLRAKLDSIVHEIDADPRA